MTSLEQLRRLRGLPEDPRHLWVRASPFRAHVRDVMTADRLPWRVVAGLAGVPDQMVHTLVVGRDSRQLPRLPRRYAKALLALDRDKVARVRAATVNANTVTRALIELTRCGLGVRDLAPMLDLPAPQIEALLSGTQPTTSGLVSARALAAARAHGINLAERAADLVHAAAEPLTHARPNAPQPVDDRDLRAA